MSDDADLEMIRSSVAKLAERYGRAYWLECTHEDRPMDELWRALGDMGFLGVTIPEQYGGSGSSVRRLAVVQEELAAHGVLSLMLVVSAAVGSVVLARHGDEAQRARYLPRMASGDSRLCFAITEPDAGSNTFDMRTLATRHGDGYRIRGQKVFISGFDASDHVLLVARTSPRAAVDDKREGISLFVVDARSAGLEYTRMNVELQGPEHQWALHFDDVYVPESARIGEEGRGLEAMFDALNPERIVVAATCVGLGRYAIGKAVDYARTREVFGVPIGAHQGLAHPLAEAHTQVELSALATEHAARLFDEGHDASLYANMAKMAAADAALAAVDQALQVHGGSGFTTEVDLIGLWPWARLMRTAPVSRELVLNHIAQHGLGLPRSS